MTNDRGELWREIKETRLVKPAFEGMAAHSTTSMLGVPKWMDSEHLEKLLAILRWGTKDRAVEVFEDVDQVEARFDGVAILQDEAAGPADKDSSAGVLARITHDTARALAESSSEIRKAVSDKNDQANRKLWHKLYTVDSYIPVRDPVYAAEAMDRLLTRPELETEKVGAALLVEHVRKVVDSALREPVMEIVRKAIEGMKTTFEIDGSDISAEAAMALAGADLGRFHEGLPGLPDMQLVSVDSPLVRSIILDRESGPAAERRERVVKILKGV